KLVLNEEALALVVAAARRLAREEGIAPPTADGLLAVPGVLEDGGQALEGEAAERRDAALLQALTTAIGALLEARIEEGRRPAAVLAEQVAKIESLTEEANAVAAEAAETIKARIRDQLALLTGETMLSPERLHQEALLAATRADVREEIDRLRSH